MSGEVRLAKVPTTVACFRMSAVMWNAHRVHFDEPYATGVEGHAGLIVPANLLSSYLCEAAMAYGRVERLTFRPRTPVVAGTQLTVVARQVSEQAGVAELELFAEDAAGGRPVTGSARVRLPDAKSLPELLAP